MQFAKRVQALQVSPAMVIDAKAKEMKQKGIPVINLSAGEPDFETPQIIKEAANTAINKNMTRYSKSQGVDSLRVAISQKFTKENNLSYDPSQIIVGIGSKQLFYSAFQVLCEAGDEVIIPVPAWPSFIEQVKLAGAKPVLLALKPPFKLTAAAVASVITPRTKVLVINSPSNPTGMMIDRDELEKIADLAVKHNFWMITDEIYERLVYTEKPTSIASLNESIKERTLTVNGVSKTYAMTGWRVGYAGGPTELIQQMNRHQSHVITHVSLIPQMAALAALQMETKEVEMMRQAYQKRREYLSEALQKLPQLSFVTPEGAFYFFISIEKLLGNKYTTSVAWCEDLLGKEQVAVVPGEAFYCPGYFRMSFAASIEDLQEAMKRITRFIV